MASDRTGRAELQKYMNRYFWPLTTLFLMTLLLQGCSTTLQSSWRDFNAYFNTFYNAKTSFDRGLELQEDQVVEINPHRPIRIHPSPTRVGTANFNNALQKSADVIRFHPRSRWVDNAIELMGLSYFYQQQYFSADQKFVELLTTTSDPERMQNAILWRGRAALELNNYVEGINYMQSRLFSTEFDWDPKIEAEIKLVIAQLYVASNEYEDAEVYLAEAIPDVRDRLTRMRAHFLHGQLLEYMERYDEAFEAYNHATHRSNPNYDLIYHAEIKLGVVARKNGDINWAYDHFTSMSRDDRHFRYIASIEYEIGKTLQEQPNFNEALQRYQQTLQRRTQQPQRESLARIYYGIAEIYRDYYLDYNMAAAYFDSSATQVSNQERLPEGFNASLLARSYGEYARLKNETDRLDSLLWLGGLSEAAFDSVIAEVRSQKMEEFERQQQEQRRQQLMAVEDIPEAGGQADEQTDNGFLNYRNPQLMQQMSQAYQAMWGSRPLVDDWRRMEAVRLNIIRQYEEEGEGIADVDSAVQAEVESRQQVIEIDLSEIPFTQEDQREMRHLIASHEYEIGNVFFTSLAMPDSTAKYYRDVMNRFPESEVAPQAIYSLSELYQSQGDSTYALQYAMQLVDFYPQTIYAERMAERYKLGLNRPDFELSREDSLSLVFNEIISMRRGVQRAGKFRNFAIMHPESKDAPEALFRSILDYIEEARDYEHEQYRLQLNELLLSRKIWEEEESIRESFRDSVQSILTDSVFMASITTLDEDGLNEQGLDEEEERVQEDLQEDQKDEEARVDHETEGTEEESLAGDTGERIKPGGRKSLETHLREIIDKEIEEPDFSDLHPYEGALWDSARVVLLAMQNEYPEYPKYNILHSLAVEIDAERMRSVLVDTERVYQCDELDERPSLIGGMDQFFVESGFQQVVDDHQSNGSVVLHIRLNEEGHPVEVSTDEEDDGTGVLEALMEAATRHMRFEPPKYQTVSVRAECDITVEFAYEEEN
ncbi:MAG: hypothetical protein WD097_08805 [Balneolales bacterium]